MPRRKKVTDTERLDWLGSMLAISAHRDYLGRPWSLGTAHIGVLKPCGGRGKSLRDAIDKAMRGSR